MSITSTIIVGLACAGSACGLLNTLVGMPMVVADRIAGQRRHHIAWQFWSALIPQALWAAFFATCLIATALDLAHRAGVLA